MNNSIPFLQFTVIDENDKNLGIMTKEAALQLADSKEMDLLCVNKKPTNPLCKILDYGKFQFLQSKKSKKSKKNTNTSNKEMRITARIGKHDLAIKLKKIREFLENGKKVKISMRLRGREAYVKDYGKGTLDLIIEELKEISEITFPPKLFNRTYNMTIAPFSSKSSKKNEKNQNEKNQNENKKISVEKIEENSK